MKAPLKNIRGARGFHTATGGTFRAPPGVRCFSSPSLTAHVAPSNRKCRVSFQATGRAAGENYPGEQNLTREQKLAEHRVVKVPSCRHMTRVFVYGTLKKGQPNYHRLFDSTNGKAEFLASALTVDKYPLVIADKRNIPFLLNIPGRGLRVHGEVYRVDDQMLRFLDDFECVPTLYQRTPVRVEVKEWAGQTEGGGETPSAGSITEAFVYSTTTYQPDWPSLPGHENYEAYGEHGLEYVTREAGD